MPTLHRTIVELILSAVHNEVGEDGMSCSFLFGTAPNAPLWARRFGATIFFSLKGITEAALLVRRHGPPYLQALSAGAGSAAETRCRKIKDLQAEARLGRLNESRVKRPAGRRLFRSA